MLELLYRLFVGHIHKWEIVAQDEMHLEQETYGGGKYARDVTLYTQRCPVCGEMRTFTSGL